MRFKWKFVVFATVSFLIFVSYKILEPDIHDKNHAQYEDNSHDVNSDRQGADNSNSVKDVEGNWTMKDAVIAELQSKYKLNFNFPIDVSPWDLAADWVKDREIHPEYTPQLGPVLHAIATRRILSADVGYKGTQLKLSLILDGGQRVSFKPKWYSRDVVISESPYAGADRHNGEIAAFHLNRILDFRRAPIVVGRNINLRKEIYPVGTERLLQTFYSKDGNMCFYGKCYYCKGNDTGVCGEGEELEGALVLWLPKKYPLKLYKHPWSRTYKHGRPAKWEHDDLYCQKVRMMDIYRSGSRLLDLIDTCILDYLIGNADRHHYETLGTNADSMVLMIDNAKSFGNPYIDELTILAPLYQCCRLRYKTWEKLLVMQDGVLSNVLRHILKQDPISPVVTEKHLQALDRRLITILNHIQTCIENHGLKNVLVQDNL